MLWTRRTEYTPIWLCYEPLYNFLSDFLSFGITLDVTKSLIFADEDTVGICLGFTFM